MKFSIKTLHSIGHKYVETPVKSDKIEMKPKLNEFSYS